MIAAQHVLLLVARVLVAALFFTSARDKFRLGAAEVQRVASLHLPVPAFFLVLTGVFEGAGGAALVLGVYARVAAGALALFTVFVTLVFVRFWSFEGPMEMRTVQRNIFVGNGALTADPSLLIHSRAPLEQPENRNSHPAVHTQVSFSGCLARERAGRSLEMKRHTVGFFYAERAHLR